VGIRHDGWTDPPEVAVSRETWIAIFVVVGIVGLITLYGAIRLLIKLVRTRRHLGELGTAGKLAFYGSLIYTIFPIDLLPDPIYLDDMAVLGTALFYLTKLLRRRGGQIAVPHGRSTVDSSTRTAPRR
jgi:uncharacterized membrane protein YkvA (DUF1232 family)